jgi:hypothetical protein
MIGCRQLIGGSCPIWSDPAFEEHGGKTVQTFHQRPFLNVERRDSHVDGWNGVFDKLQAYVAKLAKEHAA